VDEVSGASGGGSSAGSFTGSFTGSSVRAVARIAAEPDGRGGTALPLLAGDGPLALRRTSHPEGGGAAQVTIVGAMAAPLGGDRLRIEVSVAAGARLRVTSAAATVSLPGRIPAPAHYDLDLSVAEGGELEWLPEPVIAAQGSELRMTTRVTLASGARLLLREEQVLGRSEEAPGRITARLTLRHNGLTALDQQTDLGPGAPGWDGPAVLAGHRAVGQLLLCEPALAERAEKPATARFLTEGAAEAALLPLAGAPALLVTAAAPDGLRLRRLIDKVL
jgi:urease accessory protein